MPLLFNSPEMIWPQQQEFTSWVYSWILISGSSTFVGCFFWQTNTDITTKYMDLPTSISFYGALSNSISNLVDTNTVAESFNFTFLRHVSGHSIGPDALMKLKKDLYSLTQGAGQNGQLRLRPESASLQWNKNNMHVESIKHASRRNNVYMPINALKI